MREIKTNEFEEILNDKNPVILDFYSDECAPCEALAPKFSEMDELFGDKVRFYKIFRQQNRDLANKLGVVSSPTLLFFQDGKEVSERLNGGIKKSEILSRISRLIDPNDFNKALTKKEKKIKQADVMILGGGPAGLTAALYSAQAKLKTIIIDPELPGGQVKSTHIISNYPGTGKAMPGYELMHYMEKQAKDSGAEIVSAVDITDIQFSKNGEMHSITVDRDTTIYAKSVILTMGARPRLLNISGEKEFKGQGVSYCSTCDGKYFDEKEIVVIGGGNSAVEESLFLTRFATKLTIIHQLDALTANKTAQELALNNPKVQILYNSEPRKFEKLENGKMKIEIENIKTKNKHEMETDGIFVFVGMIPNMENIPDIFEKDQWGYLKTDEDMKTNIPGIYAAGDLRSKKIRQAATAVGDGCIAGVVIEKYVEEFNARSKRSN